MHGLSHVYAIGLAGRDPRLLISTPAHPTTGQWSAITKAQRGKTRYITSTSGATLAKNRELNVGTIFTIAGMNNPPGYSPVQPSRSSL